MTRIDSWGWAWRSPHRIAGKQLVEWNELGGRSWTGEGLTGWPAYSGSPTLEQDHPVAQTQIERSLGNKKRRPGLDLDGMMRGATLLPSDVSVFSIVRAKRALAGDLGSTHGAVL